MKISELQSKLDVAARLIAGASSCVALTGAGISVDSGIPDFRSAGGLWERFDPMDYAHIDSFRRNPHRVWNMLREMRKTCNGAASNPGHLALAKLERLNRLKAVITQNIDNLHQHAGSGEVVEFHGNAGRLACLKCGHSYHAQGSESLGDPPVCGCGAVLKPDVVFFGEAIPAEALRRSNELCIAADLMIVAGTSAQVAPANLLPEMVVARGGRLIEVNLESTHLSSFNGTVVLRGSTSEILPELAALVEKLLQ